MSPSLISGLAYAGVILILGTILVAACCGGLTALAWIADGVAGRLP